MSESRLRQQLASFSRRIWERGWVANHDGNLSARLPRGRTLCTPTGLSKAEIKPEMMLVVDGSGRVVSGNLRPFSELSLHLAWYQARSDVQAVIHAHPEAATGFGVAGLELDQPFLPEAVVSLGPVIPTVPLSLPGTEAVQAVAPYLDDHDALLLAGNGVFTAGVDVEQAYLRLELVEHLARIALVAHQLGGVRPLPAHFLPPLLAARARAGLGPEGRGARASAVGGHAAPATGGGSAAAPEGLAAVSREELERVIQAEIKRVLAKR